MSEAEDPKKEPLNTPGAAKSPAAEPDTAKPKAPPPPPPAGRPASSGSDKASSSGNGKALASLALLIALAGLGVGGYSLMQARQAGDTERQQLQRLQQQVQALQGVDAQARQLTEADRQLAARLQRLEQLPSASDFEERHRLLGSLLSEQQRLSGRVEQVLGASREQWRLAEAEHLLRMAMLRLSAMQDIGSAAMLLEEADLILQRQNDPGAYGARQKLLEGLEALRSLPDLDRTGLFLQLGALRGQTAQLNGLLPEFEMGTAQDAAGEDSRWRHWLNELTRYVRIDFNAGNDVKPLLAGQGLAQVRLALSLAIEQAQWAVLNGNGEVYRQSLQQAVAILEGHFSAENGQSRGLRDRIEALSQRQVAVTLPDLAPALRALQVYVEDRDTPQSRQQKSEEQPADAAPPQAEPATDQEDVRT